MKLSKLNILKAVPVAALLLLFPSILCTVTAADEADIGIVTYVKGTAYLYRTGEKIDLKVDKRICPGDVVETDEKSKVRIIFYDDTINGSHVLGPGSRLVVSELMAAKTDRFTIEGMAHSILKLFRCEESEIEVVTVSRAGPDVHYNIRPVRHHLLFYPRGKVSVKPVCIMWTPVAKATEYKIDIFEDRQFIELVPEWYFYQRTQFVGTYILGGHYRTQNTRVDEDLKWIKPNIIYTIELSAWSGEEKIGKDSVLMYLTDPDLNNSITAAIEDLEKRFSDEEDPTLHLLKGNYFMETKLYSDALCEYQRYLQVVPGSRLALNLLKNARFRLNYIEAEDIYNSAIKNLKEIRMEKRRRRIRE